MREQDWQPERPLFTLHRDADGSETVTVDRWPKQIEVDALLMQNTDPSFMEIQGEGAVIHFTVANGSATYWRVKQQPQSVAECYMLESCSLTEQSHP